MEKNKGGRPLKFKTPKIMQERIDWYFEAIKINKQENPDLSNLDKDFVKFLKDITDTNPTVTGLALALDTDRTTLINYENRDEFFDTVKKAKLRVENALEQRLYGASPVGTIFNLKNNFSWEDTQTHDGGISIDINKRVFSAKNND